MSHPSQSNPLRLEQCAGCGYRLDGLPDEGVCPECGEAYDAETIVLHGWAGSSQLDVTTARPWVVIVLVCVVAWSVWDVFRTNRRFGVSDPTGYFCAAWPVLFIAWGLWRRWSSHMPGPLQVRLNPEGCCQFEATRDPSERPKMIPWAEITGIEVTPPAEGVARLRFRSPVPWYRMEVIAIDAIVKCTPQQIEAVRARVTAWRERRGGASDGVPIAAH